MTHSTSSDSAIRPTPHTREGIAAILAAYDAGTADYFALPEDEQEGRNYEEYEDMLLEVVHDFAEFVRHALAKP